MMNNTKSRHGKTHLQALQAAALEDLFSISDEDLLKEVAADGEDATARARALRTRFVESVSAARRQRLAAARQGVDAVSLPKRITVGVHPPIEVIKHRIQELFAADPSLGLAFREGKKQTNADWESLWDDLIMMGAIENDDTHRP